MLSELDSTVIEDLQFIEEVWNDEKISNVKIRQVSTCLRRLVLDSNSTLAQCARSRGVKLEFSSPDIKWIVNNVEATDVIFFEIVNAKCFGVEIWSIFQESGPRHLFKHVPKEWSPAKKVCLKLENFLSQKVLYFCGHVVQRKEILRYVCNKAGGTHFDSKRDNEVFEIMDKIRNAVLIAERNNNLEITLNLDRPHGLSRDFVFRKDHIDPVFLAVYGICHSLTESGSIQLLKQDILAAAA